MLTRGALANTSPSSTYNSNYAEKALWNHDFDYKMLWAAMRLFGFFGFFRMGEPAAVHTTFQDIAVDSMVNAQ